MNLTSLIAKSNEFRTAAAYVSADTWRHRRKQFGILLLLSIAIGLAPYAVRGSEALLLNRLTSVAADNRIGASMGVLIGLIALAYLFQTGVNSGFQFWRKLFWMERRQQFEFRLSEKMTELDIATHEDPSFQDKVTLIREQGASFAVANFLESFIQNFQNFTGVAAASLIVCAVDWRFFLIISIASVPQLYSQLKYGRGLWSIHQDQSPERRQYEEVSRHTRSLTGLRDMHAFQSAGYFLGRQKEMLDRFLSAEQGEERKRFRLMFGAQLLSLLSIVVVLAMLVARVAEGSLQIGTFVFVLSSIIGLEGTMAMALIAVADQTSEARLVAAYCEVMRLQPKIRSAPGAVTLAVTRAPEIEFRNVSFAYPTNPGDLVLRDLSLKVRSGERVALVGINGAGKSTLIKLLRRDYDPTDGAILIDGKDLRELDLESWRRHLSVLSQEFARYNLKAWENIGLGRYAPGWEEPSPIREAARRAEAHRFIEAYRDAYGQQFGQQFGGVDPSGGQWQKLALARTLFRDAFVTVLDEPTAHIDAAAEVEIFSSLQSEAAKEQSVILISHRFATVRQADRICVLRNGSIVENGSHLELVRSGGEYAVLFEKQAAGYRDA